MAKTAVQSEDPHPFLGVSLSQCGAAVAYFCFGYAFAFGDGSSPNGFIGTTNFFLMDVDDYGA
jgi:ammonia channel protein AmtB